MHLRGKRFEYNIVHKGGTIEPLLRVNWDFYWQLSYQLAQPLPLAAGTELQAVAWYDNSNSNPHNPDPMAAVRWGDQTYDEMMVGFFDVAVRADLDKWKYFERQARTPEAQHWQFSQKRKSPEPFGSGLWCFHCVSFSAVNLWSLLPSASVGRRP